MAASQKKSSALIQQLCKHIANLQETNAKLHQQICQADQQKQIVYRALGRSTWEQLLSSFKGQKDRDNQCQCFQNTSSTVKSRQGQNKLHVFVPERTPLKQRKYNYESACQSPIQSQSRLLNKSIRGSTDREGFDQIKQNIIIAQENPAMQKRKQGQASGDQNQTFLLTLNNLAIHSYSKQSLDLKTSEEQNMLLSIQNTKLRQKVLKLEAILASHQYY